jgi:hypothetical protein
MDRKESKGMADEKKEFTAKPLNKMTVTELREVAKEIPGITGVHCMKKPELLAAIKEAKGIVDEPGKKAGPHTPKVKVPKATLKAMIRDMKGKRRLALEEKDKKMAQHFRRQISKLKKKSRKAA